MLHSIHQCSLITPSTSTTSWFFSAVVVARTDSSKLQLLILQQVRLSPVELCSLPATRVMARAKAAFGWTIVALATPRI